MTGVQTCALPICPLRALILAPTRELALQVSAHLQPFGRACGVWVVPIVGGISLQKQVRLLGKAPQVVVATPGRLWDLMKEGHAHLTDLSRLSFLVVDEADRMVQQGHYSELSSILGAIPTPKQLAAAAAEEARLARADRPKRLPRVVGKNGTAGKRGRGERDSGSRHVGVPGSEAAAGPGDDDGVEEGGAAAEGDAGEDSQQDQQQQQQQQGEEGHAEGEEQEEAEEEEDAAALGGAGVEEGQELNGDQQNRREQQQQAPRLQTFVFSATLTLPADLRRRLRRGGGGASNSSTLETLMDQVPLGPKPKIVDLTSERRLADKVGAPAGWLLLRQTVWVLWAVNGVLFWEMGKWGWLPVPAVCMPQLRLLPMLADHAASRVLSTAAGGGGLCGLLRGGAGRLPVRDPDPPPWQDHRLRQCHLLRWVVGP